MSGLTETNAAVSADLQRALQPNAGNLAPSDELAPAGLTVADAFVEARHRLRSQSRGPHGRFVAGGGAVKDGTRSALLAPQMSAWVAEVEKSMLADLGGADDLPETLRILVRVAARSAVEEEITWHDMMASGGSMSAKSYERRIAERHGRLVDRVARLVKDIGLERKARPVATLEHVLAQHEDPHGA